MPLEGLTLPWQAGVFVLGGGGRGESVTCRWRVVVVMQRMSSPLMVPGPTEQGAWLLFGLTCGGSDSAGGDGGGSGGHHHHGGGGGGGGDGDKATATVLTTSACPKIAFIGPCCSAA
jgi:hypothetical protein